MADFTRIACAYAEYAGIGSRRMLGIIMKHSSRQTEEVLQADPVATAILHFIKKQVCWTGTATELLNQLNRTAPGPRPEKWPRQANNLARQMNVLQATLEEADVSVTKHKKGRNGDKQVTLEYKAKTPFVSSAPSKPSPSGDSSADGNLNASSLVSSLKDVKRQIKYPPSVLSTLAKPSSDAASGDTDGKDDIAEAISRDSGLDTKQVDPQEAQ